MENAEATNIIELQISVARLEEKLKASASALELARLQLEVWKASANEWRQENVDQRRLYMTLDKAESVFNALSARTNALEGAAQRKEGKEFSSREIVAWLIAAISIVVSIIALKH